MFCYIALAKCSKAMKIYICRIVLVLIIILSFENNLYSQTYYPGNTSDSLSTSKEIAIEVGYLTEKDFNLIKNHLGNINEVVIKAYCPEKQTFIIRYNQFLIEKADEIALSINQNYPQYVAKVIYDKRVYESIKSCNVLLPTIPSTSIE